MSKWKKINDTNAICRLIVIIPTPDDPSGPCTIAPPIFVKFWA